MKINLPMPKRSPMTRFKLPGSKGYIRQVDNRVIYPPNLVRDVLVVYLCNPRTTYVNYWQFGASYDPMAHVCVGLGSMERPPASWQARGGDWARVRIQRTRHACLSQRRRRLHGQRHHRRQRHGPSPRDLREISERRLQRLSSSRGPTDSSTSEATIRRRPRFGRGTRGNLPGPSNTNSRGSRFWKNSKTGKRVLLFQDPFAEPFEKVDFKVVIDGRPITRKAEGQQSVL